MRRNVGNETDRLHGDALQQFPMEFMAETQKLIGISLGGCVG